MVSYYTPVVTKTNQPRTLRKAGNTHKFSYCISIVFLKNIYKLLEINYADTDAVLH